MRFQIICGAAIASFLGGVATAQQVNQAVGEAERATQQAQASQQRINTLDDQRGELFAEYRATLQRIEARRLYVEQQRVFLSSQENEINNLRQQISQVDEITAGLLPMQTEMVDRLGEFISLDTPFLLDERLERVARARETLDRHNVAPAEKYRSILEAYAIENDYGRFAQHWEGTLPGEDNRLVDFVRYGRISWVYMTKDESELGIWNAETESWDSLPGSFREDVRQIIRILDETTSPDIVRAPMRGAVDATQ